MTARKLVSDPPAARRAKAPAEKWPLYSAERPQQTQNRLAGRLIAALANDFEKHGAKAVAAIRADSPTNYLRLVASLMPKELHDEDPLDEVSDDELVNALAELRALAASRGEAIGDIDETSRKEPAQDVSAVCQAG